MSKIDQIIGEIKALLDRHLEDKVWGKTHIIIHHSASKDHPAFDWGELRRWHLAKGWRNIGYHFGVELVDGHHEIILGRFEHETGAHCQGEMNRVGIGICVVGNFQLEPPPKAQWDKTLALTRHLMDRLYIPVANVQGHGEVAVTLCPGKHWDMAKFRRELAGL